MQLPTWCEEKERLDFIFRLAALYHNRDGSLRKLAEAIGRSNSYFTVTAAAGKISADGALEIERAIGYRLFDEELIRPETTLNVE